MGSAESSSNARSQEDSDVWWTGPSQRAESRPDHADTLETLVRQVTELKEQLCVAERVRPSMQDPGGGGDGDEDDGGGGSFESNAQRRQHELDLLKRDLSLKREARQKKISAVTAEMDRLRNELASERAERIRLERQLGSGTRTSGEMEPFNTTEELCKVREDLATERRIRDAVTAERDQLTSHNKQLLATFEKMSDELRRERANNEALVVDNEKMSSVIAEGELCIDGMKVDLDKAQAELREVRNQVLALKDVAAISAQMLAVREVQVKDMKHKLTEIEAKIKSDNVETAVSSLREEYETQIKNIKDLKQLYEDRARALETEKQSLLSVLEEKKSEVDTLKSSSEELDAKVQKLEDQLRVESDKTIDLELQLGDSVAECRSLNNQMSRINELFTQMLLGAVTANGMNLDKMSRLLHENHDLIADITSKGCGTDHAPALPKLILDLLNQIERENTSEAEDVSESSTDDVEADDIIVDVVTVDDEAVEEETSTVASQPTQSHPEPEPQSVEEASIESENLATDSKEELVNQISSNLPKVWKVLLELVSQQGGGKRKRRTSLKGDDACYKAVDTPRGPQLVISVSKTYLRLKDLILEKRHLEHELSRLKSLNGHLEARLDEQAQRLSFVQSELHKTWGVVGRMKAQHQQLHTHEKILRYELHQKRELLNELKQELEYCREKWESARQKNSETAREWRQLRKEFAARRARDSAANNSGESGLGEEETSCEEESSARSDSPVLNQEAKVPLSLAEDIPVLEADELVASNLTESSAYSSVVQTAEPAQVAVIHETEAEHSTVELHTEQIQVAVVREAEPAQVAVVVQMEEAQVAAVLESEPTQVAAAVVLESPPAQVAVVSQSPTGMSSTATSDESSDDGMAALKARALVQFAKRSAEYLQEERQEEARARAPPLALPRRTRMQPARAALQSMSVTPSVFDVTSPNPNQSPSYFFGTRGPARTIDFESDVTPQIERSIDTVLDARAARLQRLEQQAQLLANRVSNTTQRSQMLSSRLEQLHEQYGPESPRRSRSRHATQTPSTTSLPPTVLPPPPPPMPETLPSLRLPTEIDQRESDDSENPDN